MRPTYLILGLVALTTVISLVVAGDPERAERLSTMYRDAAFSGESRIQRGEDSSNAAVC